MLNDYFFNTNKRLKNIKKRIQSSKTFYIFIAKINKKIKTFN